VKIAALQSELEEALKELHKHENKTGDLEKQNNKFTEETKKFADQQSKLNS
jgi:hypothetical protein